MREEGKETGGKDQKIKHTEGEREEERKEGRNRGKRESKWERGKKEGKDREERHMS
jgi:hypothetical protein